MTISGIDLVRVEAHEADATLQMDEEAFRAFYDRTARALWSYLSRMTGDRHLADDLLQEAYYRFLRAPRAPADDAHRRNYLFRIATNLLKDHRRGRRGRQVALPDENGPGALAASGDLAAQAEARTDLTRAMSSLRPRDRSMLWLAYAQGASHREIAVVLGLKPASIKLLLFRARRRLARLLQDRGAAAARRESGREGTDA